MKDENEHETGIAAWIYNISYTLPLLASSFHFNSLNFECNDDDEGTKKNTTLNWSKGRKKILSMKTEKEVKKYAMVPGLKQKKRIQNMYNIQKENKINNNNSNKWKKRLAIGKICKREVGKKPTDNIRKQHNSDLRGDLCSSLQPSGEEKRVQQQNEM